MSQSLPTHGFRFLPQDDISTLKLQELSDDAEDGYIFEVDLPYSTCLHHRHDDCPLAPESLVIDRSMYSSTQQAAFPESTPQRKQTPNLGDKVKYVVHYRNLELCLHGLVVTKVHRLSTIKLSPWLKAYIDFNIRQRSLDNAITDCLTVVQCKAHKHTSIQAYKHTSIQAYNSYIESTHLRGAFNTITCV